MKRDFDLIREILLKCEETLSVTGELSKDDFPQYSDQLVGAHMELLYEAGFVELQGGKVLYSSSNSGEILSAAIKRVTWNGHEFINLIKKDTVWAKVKDKCMEVGGGLALELIKKSAEEYIKQFLP